MKSKKIKLNYRGKKFDLNLGVCNAFERFIGLMFTSREKAKALLFEFDKPTNLSIHSYFVFFSFVAIWLDTDGKVINVKLVKPFSLPVSSKKSFEKLIEIPINKKYKSITEFIVNSRKI